MSRQNLLLITLLFNLTNAFAANVSVAIHSTEDNQASLGTVMFEDTTYGLLITPNLRNLPTGIHGFHLHQHSSCEQHGMAAGGHFDPMSSNTHQGPYGKGHLGDLPILYVNEQGNANTMILAPRLKTSDLRGKSIMIHAGGDTYSDTPKLGGGGARIACGVFK